MLQDARIFMKKYRVTLILIPLFLTLFLTIRACTLNKVFILSTFFIVLLLTFVSAWITFFLSRQKALFSANQFLEKILYRNYTDRTLFFAVWILMIIFWLIPYLAFFPGIFGYDVPIQMQQYFGYDVLTSANPLLHTLTVGFFFDAGYFLFGRYQAGLALFTAFQVLIVTSCCARSLLFLKKKGTPVILLLIGLLWFLWNPALQVLSMNATKDILFGAFLLHFVICFFESLKKNDMTRKSFLRLLICGVLMCLFRNGSDYLILILLVICLLTRIRKKKIYICLFAIWGISRLFSIISAYGFDIPTGDSREFLSVPIQQLAYVRFADAMTEEQSEIINEILPAEEYEFMYECADFPKAAFRTEQFKKDPKRYIHTYLEIGRENYDLYWAAFCYLASPYFDMRLSDNRCLSLDWTFPMLNTWDMKPDSKLPAYALFTEKLLSDDNRFYNALIGAGVYLLCILFCISLTKKDKITLLGTLLFVLYLTALMFCPVARMRYLYPVMLATPLLSGLLFT